MVIEGPGGVMCRVVAVHAGAIGLACWVVASVLGSGMRTGADATRVRWLHRPCVPYVQATHKARYWRVCASLGWP